jgi:hypothetical protein
MRNPDQGSRGRVRIVIAATGHELTQSPHPVHNAESTRGRAKPSASGRKEMAIASQESPQARHTMPRISRQSSPMVATLADAWGPLPTWKWGLFRAFKEAVRGGKAVLLPAA